jgi:hypothetical protein
MIRYYGECQLIKIRLNTKSSKADFAQKTFGHWFGLRQQQCWQQDLAGRGIMHSGINGS